MNKISLTLSLILWIHLVLAQDFPFKQAFSHNDYAQKNPLQNALNAGFNCVEVDLFLQNGELMVAHEASEINSERTFKKLYLDPLQKRIEQNHGWIYPKNQIFILYLDLKTKDLATYQAIQKTLANYPEMITEFSGKTKKSKGILVITGNQEFRKGQAHNYSLAEGGLEALKPEILAQEVYLINLKWSDHFTWYGKGDFPKEQMHKLHEWVKQAHKQGKIIRFWGTPDFPDAQNQSFWAKKESWELVTAQKLSENWQTEVRTYIENFWHTLHKAHVDFISTDNLPELQRFLTQFKTK